MRLFISTPSQVKTAVSRTLVGSFMLLGLGFPLVVAAEQPEDEDSSAWGFGFAVGSTQKAYTDIDRDTKVLPILTYENKYIKLAGPELVFKLPGYTFSDSSRLNLGIVSKYETTDYKQSDAPILNGMEDRDGGFWGGFKAEWENSFADITVEFLTEISGDSDGSAVNLGIERTWHFNNRFVFSPRLEVHWLDMSFTDYYYGVSANEVMANRPYYNAEAGVNIEIGARGGYMFKQKHFVFMDVSVTSLASEIKDSPLVDRSTENRVILGYIYNF